MGRPGPAPPSGRTARASSRSTVARPGATRASSPTSRWARAGALPGFDEAGYPPAPGHRRFDEIRPGCYDPVERIKDMDIDGVWGQLCFPNYARFAGHRFFLNVKDQELGTGLPARLQRLPARRVVRRRTRPGCSARRSCRSTTSTSRSPSCERVVAKGAKAVAFSENPTVLGLPSVHTDHWDPLWARRERRRHPGLHAHRQLVQAGDHLGRRAADRARLAQRRQLHDGRRRLAAGRASSSASPTSR